jgi:hypothetical protein
MATAAGVRIQTGKLQQVIEATDANLSIVTVDELVGKITIIFSVAGGYIQHEGAVQGSAPSSALYLYPIGGGESELTPGDAGVGHYADWTIGVAGSVGTKAHISGTLR